VKKLFGKSERKPRVKAVFVTGGFAPVVPEPTQRFVYSDVIKQMIKERQDFADLWKRTKRRSTYYSNVVMPRRVEIDELKSAVSMALALAAGIDLDTLASSGRRFFLANGTADLPNFGSFNWNIQFYFDLEG